MDIGDLEPRYNSIIVKFLFNRTSFSFSNTFLILNLVPTLTLIISL